MAQKGIDQGRSTQCALALAGPESGGLVLFVMAGIQLKVEHHIAARRTVHITARATRLAA
jgi:hypothetical protein